MKVFLKLLLLLALVVYMVFAFVRFNKTEQTTPCTKLTISITDASQADFVSEDDILRILKDAKLYPVGKNLDEVHLGKIKKAVEGHQFVMRSLCYATPKGEVVVEVSQKLPVLRVLPCEGEGYYIDAGGNKIPHDYYPADVIVVTGHVNYPKAKSTLAQFGHIIQEDGFWNDMIEQINFTPSGKIELSPRVGNHIVELGRPQNLSQKLAHLKIFYNKVLNKVGWNKYHRISLEYNNQVVCTKSETENKQN